MRGNPKQSLDSGLFHAVDSRFQVIDSAFPDSRFQLLEGYWIPLACEQAFPGHSGGGAGKGRSRTLPLSLKTMEVQIKRDQWNKRFRTVQVYWGKGRRICNCVSGIWIPPPIPLWLPVDWAVRFPPISANVNKHWKTRVKGNDVITNVISANKHFQEP